MESSIGGAIPEESDQAQGEVELAKSLLLYEDEGISVSTITCSIPPHLAEIILTYLPHPICLQVAIRIPSLSGSFHLWRDLCQRQYPVVMRRGKGKRKKHRKMMQESNTAHFWRSRYHERWTATLRLRKEREQKLRNLKYQYLRQYSKSRWKSKMNQSVRHRH
mmetsp:Transcript_33024/g.53398  ORF Transcript_33024/g.53398 Transcript_33024/m.53398 type:complete len:163 (+) Transcript_33024:18-506(+)|eukprot:jgi/Bigna1/86058/estExt_fgenesh1_pg.C_70353